jgi:hypothetical protein
LLTEKRFLEHGYSIADQRLIYSEAADGLLSFIFYHQRSLADVGWMDAVGVDAGDGLGRSG